MGRRRTENEILEDAMQGEHEYYCTNCGALTDAGIMVAFDGHCSPACRDACCPNQGDTSKEER